MDYVWSFKMIVLVICNNCFLCLKLCLTCYSKHFLRVYLYALLINLQISVKLLAPVRFVVIQCRGTIALLPINFCFFPASNRVVSVSLLLGMSLIIGYHLGSHGHGWISHLSNKVLKALGFRRDKGSPNHQNSPSSSSSSPSTRGRPDGRSTEYSQTNSSLQKKKYSSLENGYQRQLSFNNSDEELMYEDEMETRMSDLTCDSAIDVNYNFTGYDGTLSEDDIDEQLMEIFNYDHLYGELYNSGGSKPSSSLANSPTTPERKNGGEGDDGDDSIRRGRFRTGTVDRIDQVLQQVDDIKRSIVEIDDELYQIAGATYANFNPNFLSLTNAIDEEYDDLLFDEASSQRAASEDRNSSLSRQSSTASALASPASNQHGHLDSVNNGQLLTGRTAKTTTTSSSSNARRHRQTDSDAQSHASLSSLDLDGNGGGGGLQLEWDFDFEPGNYEYYDSSASASKAAQTEFNGVGDQTAQRRGASPLKEKLSSAASGLELPMTDEQKLKNMHDLLDEAKRMGLLNNIIDALAPSKDKYKTVRKGEEKNEKVRKSVPI